MSVLHLDHFFCQSCKNGTFYTCYSFFKTSAEETFSIFTHHFQMLFIVQHAKHFE